MNQLKLLSGAAVACVACCAIPIGGAFMATALASSAMALLNDATAIGGALMLVVIATGASLAWGRRRRLAKASGSGCACPQDIASTDASCGTTSCGVRP